MMGQFIDGYCHCGLSKYRPIEDVGRVMDRYAVARAVLVQHLGEYDNSYIGGIVAAAPDRFAGVMLVDVESPSAEEDLDKWAEPGVFRGVRMVARTLLERPDVWDLAAERGLNIVVYDESGIAPYADSLGDFAAKHPATRLVLPHLGVLDRDEHPGFASHGRILSLGPLPNVFIQISGMHMFARPPYTELVPLVEGCLAAFGPERALYGSNYPVMRDDAVYGNELELVSTGRLGVPLGNVEQVMVRTASRLWFDRTLDR